MRISEKKVYRYSPVFEDTYFNAHWPLEANGERLVFASRKVPGTRGTLPSAFVYVYTAERFGGIVSTHWMRGRLLGMARIGSLTPVPQAIVAGGN